MKKYLLLISFCVCYLFRGENAFASHLVGGDITVAYSGSPNYFNITVKLYRDASSSTQFENTIYVGIYDKATNAYYGNVTLSNPTLTSLSLGNGCYTPSISIQRAVYVTNNVYIADNANGYYLSYNRCCRNAVIANINTPSSEGFTAYCEIPNPTLHDNTPTFNVNPDGYMCQGFINTDQGFSATDADGDLLVYSFVTPLSCSAMGQCDNAFNVDPGCSTCSLPGPYGTVTWGAGYSLSNMMGDPTQTINSSTGIITTTPPNLGVYIFCVKVEEWRSGVKIGEIRRDFQFDVLSGCSVLTIGSTPANPVCLGATVTLSPAGASSSFTYSWNPGGATTSAITFTPASAGTYNYTVTATNGACSSTATAGVIVTANPAPSISSSGNPCLGQTMTLTASGGTTYSWSNGIATAAMSTATAGTYTVWATTNGCVGINSATIYAPVTAGTYTWTGAASASSSADNWFNSVNWSVGSGCIPTCSKDVVIPPSSGWTNPGNYPDINIGNGAASCRSITLNSGVNLKFSNVASELDICGDFTDNGVVLNAGGNNGVLKFMGTVSQNYIKTSGGSVFHSVVLNNTATVPSLTIKEGAGYKDLSLDNSGTFTFTNGYLVTEGSRLLELKNTAANAISGYGASSYVYGRLKRYVATGISYDFPVGGNPSGTTVYPYELMNINFSAISGGLTNLTVCFDNPGNSTGSLTYSLPISEQGSNYTTLLNNGGPNTGAGYPSNPGTVGGIWTVIPDAGTGTYLMTLYGKNHDNAGTAGSYFSVMKRSTYSMCGTIPTWALDGSVSSNGLSSNVVNAARAGMSGFSQFAIAKHITPLPVELISFDAACEAGKIKLSWATATELNNDHFTLERSCDENLFQYQTIATIKGAGNSSTVRLYSYIDNDETAGTCYYRLSQTDFDGTAVSFAPLSINCKNSSAFNFVGIIPNPAQDEMSVLFFCDTKGKITITITDMLGQIFFTKESSSEIGLNKIEVQLADFASGVYFVKLDDGKKSFIKKLVKKD